MMNWLFAGMICLSFVFAVCCGRVEQLSAAALEESVGAVKLVIELCGGMCLWSGAMRVAQRSGLTERLSRLMSPILRPLFKEIPPRCEALRLVSMNMVANLIGLGNAVIPLGIAAMRELERCNPDKKRASDAMVMFVVLNTASLQIVPTTTAMLRLAAGSSAPMEIVPAVWIASLCSVASGVAMVFLLNPLFRTSHTTSDLFH